MISPCSNCLAERLCSSPCARVVVVRAVERDVVRVCPECGARRTVSSASTDAEAFETCARCATKPLALPELAP